MPYKENSKPIYMQIADRICDEVMSGKYQINDRIPSVREASLKFQVNVNTMMRAYEYLARCQIIKNQRGIGFFVTNDAYLKITEMRKHTFFDDELKYFFDRLQSMGVTPDHVTDLYTNYLDQHNE